jgi:4-amino-4-deoxychorismate lyase
MMNKWLINGTVGDQISIADRGFTYGDGLFETIAVRDGKIRFFNHHLERLFSGAEQLSIEPPERELLSSEAIGLTSECEYGTLKIILTRGAGRRGYAPPEDAKPVRLLALLPGTRPQQHLYTDGIIVRHCATPIGYSPATAGLKTLGRLEQVLARAEWQDASITEGLMSTTDGLIVCGTMSNLFLVQDGILMVPSLEKYGINGIMRRVVLDSAAQIGLQCRIGEIPCAAVNDADELFVTNSLIGIWPIRRVDKMTYPVGPVTRILMRELAAAGVSECAAQ